MGRRVRAFLYMAALCFANPVVAGDLAVAESLRQGDMRKLMFHGAPVEVPSDVVWTDTAGATGGLADYRGRWVLLNFWATWCPPCVEELPMLNAFYREHAAKGWQVLGLAIDQPSAVRKFLARIPLDFPVGLAGLGGTDLGRSLGNLTGGLPFTVVLGGDGRVLHRKMGQVTPDDLKLWSVLH